MTAILLRLKLLGLALAIGLAIVILGNAATDLVIGDPILGDGDFGSIDAVDVAIMHLIGASLPMVVLAFVGSRSWPLWSTAVVLTALFWAYATLQIWGHSLTGFQGGADIGLGLIMLASPFVVLAAVGLLAWLLRGERR